MEKLQIFASIITMLTTLTLSLVAQAQGPAWWSDAGIAFDAESPPQIATIGQVKYIASKAWQYFDETLPGGAGFALSYTVSPEDYDAAVIGQIKAASKPFHDRLGNSYPWLGNGQEDFRLYSGFATTQRLFEPVKQGTCVLSALCRFFPESVQTGEAPGPRVLTLGCVHQNGLLEADQMSLGLSASSSPLTFPQPDLKHPAEQHETTRYRGRVKCCPRRHHILAANIAL